MWARSIKFWAHGGILKKGRVHTAYVLRGISLGCRGRVRGDNNWDGPRQNCHPVTFPL